ncbi:MAG TPA: hypothetical protein VKH42_19360 [Vicinamibacterales bacterium]|nr:hypothetical protein [Vicinamibacterales bacterium]
MRRLVAILVITFLAVPIAARADEGTHRFVKVVVGAGALVTGVAVMATSSKTTTVNSAVGTSETSEFSKSQLITGAAVAGVGGILLWDGLRDHDRNRPSTQVIVSPGKTRGIFIRRVW